MQNFCWQTDLLQIPQHPVYSPGITLSGFHLLDPPNNDLDSKCYVDEAETEYEAHVWLRQQNTYFHVAGFEARIQ